MSDRKENGLIFYGLVCGYLLGTLGRQPWAVVVAGVAGILIGYGLTIALPWLWFKFPYRLRVERFR